MGNYVPTTGELTKIRNKELHRITLPFKMPPAPRPKGALTAGMSGLWITHGPYVYRVTEPQARNLDNACPLGRAGELVGIKERLVLNGKGWCYQDKDFTPVTLPPGDPRIAEMIGWAHHNQRHSCPANQMPAFAARHFLKITRVSALHPDADGPWVWVVYVEPAQATEVTR